MTHLVEGKKLEGAAVVVEAARCADEREPREEMARCEMPELGNPKLLLYTRYL